MYRLTEVIIPKEKKETIEKFFEQEKNNLIDFWREEIFTDKLIYKILIKTEFSQALIDKISGKFKKEEYFRITVLDVATTIPHPQEPQKKYIGKLRISREELYANVLSSSNLNYIYITMIILSSIIAAFGLYTNNTAVIIGAMVIAPMLGPNIAISLATVLGDLDLAKKGFITALTGIATAFLLSVILGLLLHINPDISAVSQRSHVNFSDIIIAISSGIAGVLAFTTGSSVSLIGVMVSISLLPPLVTSGLLLGNGFIYYSSGAMLLFLANFASLNLAGVATFIFQDVRPKNWWEEKKAKTYRKKALILWMGLLFILILAIYLNHKHF